MPLHLLAQVPRQTQLWVASQQYSRQDSNDSRYGGVEIVNRVFSENNKNVDYLPEGSYTITKSMNRAWNNAYGKTLYTDKWWWTNPTGRSRTGFFAGVDLSLQPGGYDPGARPQLDIPWGEANLIETWETGDGNLRTVQLTAKTKINIRHISNDYRVQQGGIRFTVLATELRFSPQTDNWIEVGPIPSSKIKIYNKQLDCEGQIILSLGLGDFDVTPKVDGSYSCYSFTMTAEPTKDHYRTRSYHGYFMYLGGAPSHPGRVNLFSDPDGCSTIDTVDDAVSVGAELFITDSIFVSFPSPFNTMSNPDYLNIRKLADLDRLRDAGFSQVKQVQSIDIPLVGKVAGYGQPFPGSNFVIEINASPLVWMHELGHNLGLRHRRESPKYLMYGGGIPTGQELNRTERSAFER
jgi:hypothetical protein